MADNQVMPTDTSPLALFTSNGKQIAAIADYIEQEPYEKDGAKFQDFTVTTELVVPPELGTVLVVRDTKQNMDLSRFTCVGLQFRMQPEAFLMIQGRVIIRRAPMPR